MLPKLPIYYFQQLATLLMTGAVVMAGVFTFGNAELFDRISLVTLVAILIYFWRDKNLVTVIFVVGLGRIYNETMWLLDYDTYWFEAIIYTAAAVVFYTFRYDVLAKVAMVGLAGVLLSEIYWYFTDYPNTPQVTWPIILMIEAVVVRHCLFMRPAIFRNFSDELKSLPLDWQLYNIRALVFFINIASLFEYILRHVFKINSLFIYSLYPYVAQVLACFALWVILNDVLKRTFQLDA